MSKLSEFEGSQIFIFQTNYYTQKVSNKTCNQTKESHRLSFTLTFPLALFFTPLLCTSLLFFPPTLTLCCPLPRPHYLKVILLLSSSPRCRRTFSLSHILSFISIILGVPLFLLCSTPLFSAFICS